MRECTKCKVSKPLGEFHKRPSTRSGVCSWCKVCKNAKGTATRLKDVHKARAQKSLWRKNNPGYYLKVYWPGSTSLEAWDNYMKLLSNQQGRCALCARHGDEFTTKLEVDHCHDTGKVRGLLCYVCNLGIGLLKHDPERCIKAAEYLKSI